MAAPNPRTIRVGFCLLLLSGLAYLFIPRSEPYSFLPAELRVEAQARYEATYHRRPDPIDTLSVAAELAAQREQLELASQCFAQIPTAHPLYGATARFQQGQVLLKLNHAAEAETQFREYLALPDIEFRYEAQQFLRFLLEIQLRFEERQVLLAEMHASGKLTPAEAIFYGYPSLLRWNGEVAQDRCRQFYEQDPTNRRLQIAWAQFLGGTGQAGEGLKLIEACLLEAPSDQRAIAVQLFLLLESENTERLSSILSSLPPPQRDDPWLMLRIRGDHALSHGDLDLAEQCFQMYLENDPRLTRCYLALGEIAGKRGQSQEKARLFEVARQLALIQNRLGGAQFAPNESEPYRKLGELSLAIGLRRSAQLMAESALIIDPKSSEARKLLKDCQP